MYRKMEKLHILGSRRIKLGDRQIDYVLKASKVARCTRLEIRPDAGLCVIIPAASPVRAAEDMVRSKQRWILSKLIKFEQSRTTPPITDHSVLYLGRYLTVVNTASVSEDSEIALAGDQLTVRRSSDDGGRTPVEDWMKKQSTVLFHQLVETWSQKMGVKCARISLSSAKTRWGSCSKNGRINLNWKLVMASPEAIEYVVIHELCHIKELNHSASFWKLVQNFCPDWRARRKWLKDHETLLGA
jgi:predicted metal-dependent hydrolase